MKLFVAGSSKDIGRVSMVLDIVRGAGHVVTHDWVGGYDWEKGAAYCPVQEADNDLKGIAAADVFVLVVSDVPSGGGGMWFEVRTAFDWGKPIVILSCYSEVSLPSHFIYLHWMLSVAPNTVREVLSLKELLDVLATMEVGGKRNG